MDHVSLTAFWDELEKIAENIAQTTSMAQPAAAGKPAPVTFGSKPASGLKAETKPTNYSVVNTQAPMGEFGAATSAKMLPPPPIRT